MAYLRCIFLNNINTNSVKEKLLLLNQKHLSIVTSITFCQKLLRTYSARYQSPQNLTNLPACAIAKKKFERL